MRGTKLGGMAAAVGLFGFIVGTFSLTARGSAQASTGYEVALSGGLEAVHGEAFDVSGTAFEVFGLATLRPLAGGEVTGRIMVYGDNRWTEVARNVTTADRAGRFGLEILVPLRDLASPRLIITVGKRGGASRSFEYSLSVRTPFAMQLLTDRARYEPSETVHVFARAFMTRSGAPLRERELRFIVRDPSGRVLADERKRTRVSGAVTFDVALPASAPDGAYSINATLEGGPGATASTRAFQVARRTTERLLVSATLDQEVIAPGAALTGRVTVRTPSGAPVIGATVTLSMPRADPQTLTSGDDGAVAFRITSPLFLAGQFEVQSLTVRVQHAAHGALAIAVPYTLARSEWRVTVVAGQRYVVPEVPTSLYLQVIDLRAHPAPAGTSVEVTGPGIAPGTRAEVDADGFAEVPMRLPLGAAGRVDAGFGCGSAYGVRIVVDVHIRTTNRTELCVPVNPDALVRPLVTSPIIAPGGTVAVELSRRPSVANRPVFVEVLDGRMPIASAWAEGNASRVELTLPESAQGFFVVRARPIGDFAVTRPIDREGGVVFGTGAHDGILVRPRDAFSLAVSGQEAPYAVRGTARLSLVPSQAMEGTFATLVARDLAQHGGEADYVSRWQARFDERVTAHDRAVSRLVRSALSAVLPFETTAHGAPPIVVAPWDDRSGYSNVGAADTSRGELRDPVRLRDALLRQRLGALEIAIERALDTASSEPPDAPEEADANAPRFLVRRGNVISGFDPRALEALVAMSVIGEAAAKTLGDGPMTMAMLQEADPSFRFDRVAARIARNRLVRLMAALVNFSNPDDESASRASAGQPPERWLSRMIEIGMLDPGALLDPWGRPFMFRRVSSGTPRFFLSDRAPLFELVSAGGDGRYGTSDDVRDPFARVVPEGTAYAVASGEDALMRSLSVLAPGETTLRGMLSAYDTLSLAAREETRVSAVTASSGEMDADYYEGEPAAEMSEMLSARSLSGGSGVGSGYGRGMAMAQPAAPMAMGALREEGMDDRNAQAVDPAPQDGQASLGRAGELIRERFPATLFFAGEIALDGPTTYVDVPLADALTTYRVEAIAWSQSGFVTSARTEIRVDQDATVDAPVPPFATVGDAVRVPIRVANRTNAPLDARVELASESDAVRVSGVHDVRVPPRDAVEVIVEVHAVAVGEGALVVRAVRASDGSPLDATRRPIDVLPDARLVRVTRRLLLEGRGPMSLDVPADATPRGAAELRLATGFEFFGELPRSNPTERLAYAWLRAFSSHTEEPETTAELVALLRFRPEGAGETPSDPAVRGVAYRMWQNDALSLAEAVGAAARTRGVSDADLVAALEHLGETLPESNDRGPSDTNAIARDADTLLRLAPALRAERTGEAREAILLVVRRLRNLVANAAARVSDDAYLSVRLAVALATTSRAEGLDVDPRAVELLRRIDRDIVRVGEMTFLEERERYGLAAGRVRPTALLAIARVATGDRAGAFACIRALARIRRLDADGMHLAALALATLIPHLDGEVRLTVDGVSTPLERRNGVLVATLEGLGRPGAHVLDVAMPEGAIAWAELDLRYGRPWDAPESHALNVDITVDGPVGARDTRAGLAVTLRNRSPRALRRPILEIDLPAGVELDEPTREAITRHAAGAPTVESRTLRIPLRALSPGGTVRIPLPLRFSVAGRLRGLGVSLRDDVTTYDDAAAYAVRASAALVIPDVGAEPPAAEGEQTEPPPPPPVPLPILPMLRPLAPSAEVTR